MSEPIKKLNQTNPESYSPKTPKLINMMEQAGKKQNKVITTGNGAYIDGFPAIEWHEWGECTHSNCMTLILKSLGVETSYEQVMGLSGSCCRVSMVYGWDPGSSIVNIIYAHLGINSDNNANRFYGIDSYQIVDKKDCEKQVMKSIDAGIPVMILGGRLLPEWSILLGYEVTADGVKYFGRSYFDDNASENEIFTENRYVLLDRYPSDAEWHRLFNKSCEPTSAMDALKISLET
jgi:hypothetical protein